MDCEGERGLQNKYVEKLIDQAKSRTYTTEVLKRGGEKKNR